MTQSRPTVVGITQGVNQPSTRFRWEQYTAYLHQSGLSVFELGSHFGAYPPTSKIQRPGWFAASVSENALRVLRANKFDLRFLQRNLTSTLCTWEPLLKRPFVFDVDDAIFLGPRGASADKIAKAASLTICGNNFLANHFDKLSDTVILPTAVDSDRFKPIGNRNTVFRKVIGWSGSSSGFKYLYAIESALEKVLIRHPESMLKIVADVKPVFKSLPYERVIFEKWSSSREVTVLQEFTVGIMPLDDDLWARGKCSFKMLTYMAVGLPVVVSPVGMNNEILACGSCGFAAKTVDDWVDSISCLFSTPDLAFEMGATGRAIVEDRYSKNAIAPKLAQLLNNQL